LGLALNAQSTGKALYDTDFVHEIRISSGVPGFWDALVSNFEDNELATTPTTVPYTPAGIDIDGTSLTGIGVRIKGKSSYLANSSVKKSLKIDLNRFDVDLEYDGIAKFNLHNAAEDPSMMRDALAFHIFRKAGIPAPRVAYSHVYVNEEYYGLYVLTEQVGGGFVDNNFSGGSGNLYKGDELKLNTDDPDTDDREDLIFVINNTPDEDFQEVISVLLNVDQYLTALAVETFLENSEGHLTGLENDNYYFYNDPKTDLFNFIPWDCNQAWGLAISAGFTNLPNISILPNQLTLSERLLEVDDFKAIYLEKVCELLDWVITDELNDIIDETSDLIAPLAEADPNNTFTMEEFENDLAEGGDVNGLYRIGLMGFITQRVPQVEEQLSEENFTCQTAFNSIAMGDLVINEFVASNDSTSGILDEEGGAGDWVEIFNNSSESISFNDLQLSNEASHLRKWSFPDDVELASKDYLIVWCDKDIDDEGLHSVFNMSALGDDLILSHADGSILDAIEFGPQVTNQSLARIPNGTGDFVETIEVTFKANNDPVAVDERFDLALTIAPNPTSDIVRIDLLDDQDFDWMLKNLQGQTVLAGSNRASAILDLSELAPALYLLELKVEGQFFAKRILRQ